MADKINVLIPEETVDAKIKEIGEQISKDYAGKEVHLICILKGGVFFACELAKRITVPVSLDFMQVSSYGDATESSGIVRIKKDLDDTILKAGQDAVFELGLSKMNKELVMMIGKLKYRTSYGQNALQHSIEVAHFAGIMASELGLNQQLAKRAGLLHDLGKAVDHEMEGSHVELGAKFAKKFGENATVINAIESHHGDVPATSIIAVLISAADTLSAARPGSRSEKIENYIQRLEKLEELPKQFEGVDKVFAIQAGREIRVIVNPEKIDDLKAHKLARDVKEKIETELTYPGHIKVTVIREIRANEIAK